MIFVVIIALWAAYLVPHWLRRREELSAARSVDRFSTAMRVLSRRAAAEPSSRGSNWRWSSERVSLARPGPGSYVVMPTREDGTDVVVKRARPVEASVSSASVSSASTPGRGSTPARRSRLSAAERRTRLLVCLVALTAAGWTLVAVTPVPWVVAAVPTMLLVLDIALLVGAARRRSRASVAAPRTVEASRDVVRGEVRPLDVGPITSAVDHGAVVSNHGNVNHVDSNHVESEEYIDIRDASPTAAADPTGGWVPVPVPPPTYTLKAKARPAPTRPVASPPAPQSLDAVAGQLGHASAGGEHACDAEATEQSGDSLDLDAVLARRRAVNQ